MKLYELLKFAKNFDEKLDLGYEAYRIVKENTIDELINNDRICADLINNTMIKYINEKDRKKKRILSNIHRASHSVVTWLLGIGINENVCIFPDDKILTYSLWTQTALNHDYGYYQKVTKNKKTKLAEVTSQYNLFQDTYIQKTLKNLDNIKNRLDRSNFFSYEYDEVKNYFEYSKFFHEHIEKEEDKKEDEACDHGIIGGCMIFEKYCKNMEKSCEKNKEGDGPSLLFNETMKIACFNIASHNIFKSSNVKRDKIYEKYHLNNLLSTSDIRVKKDNRLLMLLSLVDTIECYKEFSRKHGKNTAFYQKTILDNIDISFVENKIVVDYNDLYKEIDKTKKEKKSNAEAHEILKDHVDSLFYLNTWTDFKTNKLDDYIIEIWIEEEECQE